MLKRKVQRNVYNIKSNMKYKYHTIQTNKYCGIFLIYNTTEYFNGMHILIIIIADKKALNK
ncbi:hypothetical protein CNEO4_540038 [Clostridium neonatale]|nr:hypothetical protein CNEO4_540038 [Clostridium neonatale]